MSLYGNVKKIGSASFQFDRIYANRVAMDENCKTDGVYAGRYVLVEYGERFSANGINISSTEEGTAITEQNNSFHLIQTEDGVVIQNVDDNPSFKENANIDLRKYGAVYDSTVWQKVYASGVEKYIMVAELNATVPKLDITQEKPLTYTTGDNRISDYTKGIVAGKLDENGKLIETVRLVNAVETYNKPRFDTALDTELSYLMHFPTTLNLEIDNNTINFNEKGFNMVYSYGEDKNGVSSIAWIPKGLNNYTILPNEGTDNGGNPLAILPPNAKVDVDTKMLFMSFPALGNAMNALYNLLYGKPEVKSEEELAKGAIRPYFKPFLDQVKNIPNFLTVINNGKEEYVTINEITNGENRFVLKGDYIDSSTGQPKVLTPIPLEKKQIPYTYTPSFVKSALQISNNEYKLYEEATEAERANPANWILIDTRGSREDWQPISHTFHLPSGDEDPDMEWLENVPALSEILSNNTAGLATILTNLFNDKDPLTGTIKYYLYNDWTIEDREESSGPAISNKPEIVGGYKTTFVNVESGEEKTEASHFETPGYFPNLGEDKEIIPEIAYPHVETFVDTEFSGGHYEIDFTTWQLV